MSRPRRRSTAGILLGVFGAILAAIFASRAQRRVEPEPAAQRSSQTATITSARRASESHPAARMEAPPTAAVSPGFTSRRNLEEHFEKHGEQFPGLSVTTYLAAAQMLRDAPQGGDVLELRRRDGVITRFDRATGAFLAVNRDGTIRTFFKPNDGEAYFRRQASRTPGGGP
jgi:pyocin large subunit-like protein